MVLYENLIPPKFTPLIGIIYFRGLSGLNNHSHEILFREKAGSSNVCSNNVSKQNIMFDDNQELFNKNCQKHVIPSEYLAIDGTLYTVRNQISLKQYNPNKPAKYGLLCKSLNDARFPHTYNSLVYAGKPEQGDGPFHIEGIETYKNIGRKKQVQSYLRKDEIISMDRLYTSILIANWLLGKNITVVGTLMTGGFLMR